MKKSQHFHIIWTLMVIIFMTAGCATTGVLTGGARDEIPPKLVVDKSDPNFSTNFKKRPINLVFDEFVNVDKPLQNVLVSPPLVYNPKVVARGKKVVFSFNDNEELRDSATYTINFGEAIRDLNENNIAENIRYVFSTGDVIDSLVLRGIILDAITGEPIDKATALLFDNSKDSAVITDRPYYFGQTDETGRFLIENVKPGKFQLVGLQEENNNYKYDDPTESIGYVDSIITMTDSTEPQIIRLFKEQPRPFIEDVDSTTRGLVVIKYNTSLVDHPSFRFEQEDIAHQVDIVDNTIKLWHSAQERIRWWFYIERGEETDSLRITSYQLDSSMVNKALSCGKPKRHLDSQHPDSLLFINFSVPIVEMSTNRFSVFNRSDSSFQKEIKVIPSERPIEDEFGFEAIGASGDMFIRFEPFGIIDIYGRTVDSLLDCPFTILERDGFSNLILTIKGLEEEKSYYMQLKEDNLIRSEWQIKGQAEWTGEFDQLIPKDYTLFILEDLNENKRWDAGRFLERRQPERKREEIITDLRANWDVEQEVDLSDWYEEVILKFELEEEKVDEDATNNSDENGEQEENIEKNGGEEKDNGG